MVLLHRPIVIEKSRFRAGHDMKTVGRPGVLKVVNDCRQNGGKDLQIAQPILLKNRRRHLRRPGSSPE